MAMAITTRPAERLVTELGRLGYAARVAESGLAVTVRAGSAHRGGGTEVLVWLPDAGIEREWLWTTRCHERVSEHRVQAGPVGRSLPPQRAAALIAETLGAGFAEALGASAKHHLAVIS